MSDETPSTGPEPSGREAGPETAPAAPAAEAPVPRQLDPVTEVYAPPPAQSLPPAPPTPPAADEPPTQVVTPAEPGEPTTTVMAAAPAPFAPAAPVAPVLAEPVPPVPVVAEPVPPAPVLAEPVPPAPVPPEPAPAVPATPPAAPAVPAYVPAPVPAPVPSSRKTRRVVTGVVFGVIVVILLGAIAWVLYDRFYADPTKNAQAGACLADLPTVDVGEDRAVNAARVVACSDPAAAYMIEGRLDRVSNDQAASATVCQAYPDATFIYRQPARGTGYVLCLRKLDR